MGTNYDSPLPAPSAETAPVDLLPLFNGALEDSDGKAADLDFGTQHWIVFGYPPYIGRLLNDPAFSDKAEGYEIVSATLGDGVLTSSGQKWEEDNREVRPAFRPALVRGMIGAICEEGNAFFSDLRERTRGGAEINVREEMTDLAFRTITRAVLGPVHAETARKKLPLSLLGEVFGSIRQLRGPQAPEQQARIATITERLSALAFELLGLAKEEEENDTLLSKLAHTPSMTAQNARDQIINFLFAGHETTGLSLMWAIDRLLRHPEPYPQVTERVLQEAERLWRAGPPDAEAVRSLIHTPNLMDENLRTRSPAPFIARRVGEKRTIGGIDLVPGDQAVAFILGAHHHPKFWPSPQVFDPDRFPLITEEQKGAFFPFSDGPRGCTGEGFVRAEFALHFTQLMRRFNTQVITEEAVPTADLTLQPKDPVIAYVEPK